MSTENFIRILFLCACLACSSLVTAQESQTLSQTNFIYTPDEMLEFDIPAFLEVNDPQLLAYSEAISHWSGRTTISPKILITLLRERPDIFDFSNPKTASDQIHRISAELSENYYKNLERGLANPEIQAVQSILAGQPLQKRSSQSFADSFFDLFPEEQSNLSVINPDSLQSNALPPEALFQLPYPIGESWQTWGGTHTFTGNGGGAFSSLDFRFNRAGFGSNTSNFWVSSASNGQSVRHSSCFVEVLGPDGWSTTYYHLDNVQVNTGQGVSRNTRLGNYADNLSQSLCGGGMSNGPHLHFSLKRNGMYFSLDGVVLSGYRVNAGRSNYDSNCNFFYFDNRGQKICNGSPIFNRGAQVAPPPPAPPPDLVVDEFSLNQISLLVGGSVSSSFSIENLGGPSSATEVELLLSIDNVLDTSDSVLATLPISALGAGARSDLTTDLVLTQAPGTYWLGACITAVNDESNSDNNCSLSVAIEVISKQFVLAPLFLLLGDD